MFNIKRGQSMNYFFGWIFFGAFTSLYIQFPGLYSVNGILPIRDVLNRILEQVDTSGFFFESFSKFPSLIRFALDIQLPVDVWCEFLLLVGMMTSLAVCLGFHRPVFFFAMYIIYLSFFLMGQTFLSFQWDILLLEVGFLLVLNNILRFNSNRTKILNWCFRFVIWKLMFMAGVVKLQSRCPTWEKLSALEYHFATQCLPNALAWYVHQLHPLLLRLGVAATLLIEIPCTFLLVAPFRFSRRVGAVLQALLQLLIIGTGNYNFFNFLTLALLVPVWECDQLSIDVTKADGSKETSDHSHKKSGKRTFTILGIVGQMLAISTGFVMSARRMLDVKLLPPDASCEADWQSEAVGFMNRVVVSVRDDFEVNAIVTPCCVAALGMCMCFLLGQAVLEILHHVKSLRKKATLVGGAVYVCRIGLVVVSAAVACFYIQFSAVPLSQIGANLNDYIHPTVWAISRRRDVSLYQLSSGYGLFRSMTGVGKDNSYPPSTSRIGGLPPSVVARPEIIIEGLDADSGEWKEIHFRHKPGSTATPPTFMVPHQPRLDWQMWFAALGGYPQNPWFVHLVYKLLKGNCPEVVRLLDESRYPFKDKPPAVISSRLHEYDFTRLNSSWARAIPGVEIVGEGSNEWWQRKTDYQEYMPAIEKTNLSVRKFLEGNGITLVKKRETQQCRANSDVKVMFQVQQLVCGATYVMGKYFSLCEEEWIGIVRAVLFIIMVIVWQ